MPRLSLVLLLGALGCQSAPVRTGAPDQTAARHAYDQANEAHAALVTRLAQLAPNDRAQCQLSAGDCLVLVSERRDRLAERYGIDCSDQDDALARSACLMKDLVKQGHLSDGSDFLGYENWCLTKLVTCANERLAQAEDERLERERQSKKSEIVASKAGRAARNAAELEQAKVSYLRTTLPLAADGACAAAKLDSNCSREVDGAKRAFDAELGHDHYDEKRALAAYLELKQREERCAVPQLECLTQALAPYGGTFPQTKRWLAQNFALLKQRQELGSDVSADSEAACLDGSQTAHEQSIVSAYTAYSHQPVLYFRVQLEKAFFALHQAEIACLQRVRATARPGGQLGK